MLISAITIPTLMRKILLAFMVLFAAAATKAQQLHFMTQYLQHNSMYNPAAAGFAKQNMVGVSYRNQWSSFPGNPKTYMLYTDVELKKLNAGLGAYLYKDQTGPTSRNGVQLAYSYHINARNGRDKLAIGLELRGLQYQLDKTKLIADLATDPTVSGAQNKTVMDAGAGVHYSNGKFTAGAAVSQLIGSKLQLSDVPNSTLGGKLYRHYNFIANYKINAGDDIYIIPNALVRVIENSPAEFDAGVLANYKDKIWWGINYRLDQSIIFQAGLKLADKISFGYSYDFYVTPIDVFTGGSGAHELGLRFHFDK